jgi:hypothetical protein
LVYTTTHHVAPVRVTNDLGAVSIVQGTNVVKVPAGWAARLSLVYADNAPRFERGTNVGSLRIGDVIAGPAALLLYSDLPFDVATFTVDRWRVPKTLPAALR